jgi:hypothetical protein
MAADTTVASENIVSMDISEKSADFMLIGFFVGGSEKIEIGPKDFVGPIAVEDDFGLTLFTNFTADKPVPDTCSNACNIVGFYVSDDFWNNRKKVIGGHNNFGVIRANPGSHFSCVQDIGTAFESDRVGFKGRPTELPQFFLDKGGDKGGVEATGQESGHGSLGHEAFLNGGYEGVMDGFEGICEVESGILEPWDCVIDGCGHFFACGGFILFKAAWAKRKDGFSFACDEGFHFAGELEAICAFFIEEGANAVGVSADCGEASLLIDDDYGKDPIETSEECFRC